MDEDSQQSTGAGDNDAAGAAVPLESPAEPLMDARALPGWQMERDLRIAQAAQLTWMMELREHYMREADQVSHHELETALARQVSTYVIEGLKEKAKHRTAEAARAAEMHIAQAVGRSEFLIAQQVNAAERARKRLPKVWRAFTTGRICQLRLSRITSTLQKLRTPEAAEKLDEDASEYAQTHRVGQVTCWLKHFEHTAEPTHAAQRFTTAARTRSIRVTDVDDGMSILSAVLPTLTAHTIKRRLDAAARSATEHIPHNPLIAEQTTALQHTETEMQLAWRTTAPAQIPAELDHPGVSSGFSIGGTGSGDQLSVPTWHLIDGGTPDTRNRVDTPEQADPTTGALPSAAEPPLTLQDLPTTRQNGDPRSMDQRAADTLCAWLLSSTSPETMTVAAQIGVLVDESTLTGESEAPGCTRDGRIPIPASNIRSWLSAQTEQLDWYQLLCPPPAPAGEPTTAPSAENLLAIHSHGRHPPPRLRTALWFRDRTCTAHGCDAPAEHCDADHITPWPKGETTEENLQLLCRRHHRLKSWGYNVHLPTIGADLTFAA